MTDASGRADGNAPIPRLVLAYGLLGILPFWLPVLAGLAMPGRRGLAVFALAAYGAMILSFLGGARWGMEVCRDPAGSHPGSRPDPLTVSISMLPSLFGWAALCLPVGGSVPLLMLATALVLHWIWDTAAAGLPGWYPRLRTVLSLGAVTGLLAGAAMARN